MMLKRTKLSHFYVSLSFLILSAVLFSSCESSRVGPAVPTPNPPPPTQQALMLNGSVKDASSQAAISGATIKISKGDGTVLTTLLTDNSGKYSFDASNVSETALKIGASKDGYAFGYRVATINKTANSATVSAILLSKLQVATTTLTVAAGGNASTTNTQSVASQPLSVQVPPNAVTSNVQLTVSSIPAGQLPPPPSNTQILSAGQFGPSGTQFAQPVTINFPLPYAQAPGTVYQLMILNEQTGAYTNSGFTATVNPDGTSASAQVTHFTTYTMQTAQGEVTVTINNPSTSNGTEQYQGLSSGSISKDLSIVNSISISGTGSANDSWLRDEVAGQLNFTVGASTQTLTFSTEALPSQYIQNGVQIGPNGPNEKGNWEYRVFYALQTTTISGSASGPSWNRTITVVSQLWVITHQGWYWISHDQGGAVSGPF